jgi:hypothetical protein
MRNHALLILGGAVLIYLQISWPQGGIAAEQPSAQGQPIKDMEFLFDDTWIDRKLGGERVVGVPVKHTELILKATAPWEAQGVRIGESNSVAVFGCFLYYPEGICDVVDLQQGGQGWLLHFKPTIHQKSPPPFGPSMTRCPRRINDAMRLSKLGAWGMVASSMWLKCWSARDAPSNGDCTNWTTCHMIRPLAACGGLGAAEKKSRGGTGAGKQSEFRVGSAHGREP